MWVDVWVGVGVFVGRCGCAGVGKCGCAGVGKCGCVGG